MNEDDICPLALIRCLHGDCRYWSRQFCVCDFEAVRESDKKSSESLTRYLANVKNNSARRCRDM